MPLTRKPKKSLKRKGVDVGGRTVVNWPDNDKPLPKIIGDKVHHPTGLKMVHYKRRPEHRAYARLNPKYIFEETYYTVDKKTNRPTGFATLVPGYKGGSDLVVAWDSCGACHYFWTICRCGNGLVTPRGVEYIRDKSDVSLQEGDDAWTVSHPKYQGSLRLPDRLAREQNADHRRTVDRPRILPPEPQKPASKRLKRKTGTKSLQRPQSPAERQSTPTESTDHVLTGTGLNTTALDKAAKESTEQMVKRLRKTTTAPRKLKRKK